MCWFKRGMRKVSIAIAGMLLLLGLMVWVPLSAAGAYERSSGFAGPGTGTVQATPTIDLTVTALVKDQLKQQDDKFQRENSFPWPLLNAIGGSIGALLITTVALITTGIGFGQWLRNRKDEQKKRDEDRFQAVVTGLGSKDIEARVGAAIMLRTFLRPGYKQFYGQAFDLAVAHLRLQRHTEPDAPELSDSLNQALATVFKESYPRVRDLLRKRSQFLDAASIQLDKRHLFGADLKNVWMPETFLRNANLSWANFSWANLSKGNFSEVNLSKANLLLADLSGADLSGANLSGAKLVRTKLKRAKLRRANYSAANIPRAMLLRLNLKEVNLSIQDIMVEIIPALSQLDLQKIDPGISRLTLTFSSWMLHPWALSYFSLFPRVIWRKRNREMATFVVNKIMEDPLVKGYLKRPASDASSPGATNESNSLFIFETNLSGADLSMSDLTEVDIDPHPF